MTLASTEGVRLKGATSGGFTLLEMLVTLVLISLIGAILSQAMFQISRIEQVLSESQMRAGALALRAEWVREMMSDLLPGDPANGERFKGDEHSLQGVSGAVPRWPIAGLSPFRLLLSFNEKSGRTELLLDARPLRDDLLGSPAAVPIALLSWPGNHGRLRYQDAHGEWRDGWLPSPARGLIGAVTLPAHLALETGDPELGTIYATPRTSGNAMPTRLEMEKI